MYFVKHGTPFSASPFSRVHFFGEVKIFSRAHFFRDDEYFHVPLFHILTPQDHFGVQIYQKIPIFTKYYRIMYTKLLYFSLFLWFKHDILCSNMTFGVHSCSVTIQDDALYGLKEIFLVTRWSTDESTDLGAVEAGQDGPQNLQNGPQNHPQIDQNSGFPKSARFAYDTP